MGAGGRRMRGAPARLLLPLLPWLLLLLAPEARGAPGCPLSIRSCKCSGERPKGLSGGVPGPARRRVVCSGGDLPEPPEPGLLPNGTVTLLLSNNKITGLRNGSFLGLSLLEKLDLRNNIISTVQPGAFLGLGELKRLDLSNNRIGCLTSETFQGLPRLLRLNISGNIFSSLQPGVFDELPALKVVDLGTEFLTCDCHLRWLLPWAQNRSLQLSEHTLCAYPSALHAQALGSLQEAQLCCEGALELHTHHLIPSLRQVVFQGDRLPFQCSASYLGNDTRIRWYHNRAPVEGDEQAGILLAESLIHDCTFITSELTLSHIGVWASGEWECTVSMAQGNASKKVEIVVLETSASYCPAERVANNRGDFRWPRTLAGITAYQSCLQYPFTSVPLGGGAPGTRASRRCDRAGRWEPGDYSHCLYTNDITRVLYTFVLMPINASNALTLAHQLRVYTAEAASFSDMMDVVYVAQMIQKFLGYVDQIKELVEVMVDMASNLMLVDEHLLWLAQREDKACSRIVGALERIGGAALSPHAQHISVELSAFPREVGGAGAGLHPVVYPCTALLLLCLFATIITYILNHSSIRVSRKGWHMLLNLCFHIAMTSAVFAGGITLTNYQMVCQAVGITLHYSSLSTLLWMGVKARVLHKELTWRAPPPQEGDPALPTPSPMLRFYLIAGGIPLIICGITAAVNIHNYRDHSPYCWLVWRPSLGAFYIPVALILLITWIYFLCAGLRLRGPLAQNPKAGNSRASLEAGEELRGSTRLRGSGPLLSDSGSLLATGSARVGTPGPPEDGDSLYSPGVQLGALVTTHFLYLAMWACGALAVSQRWLPRVVCSCLYGVAASALGLFVFTHHCARRRDVRASWRACCPPASPAAPHAPPRALPAAAEDGSPVFGEGPPSLKSSPSGSSGHPLALGPCKLTNLQLAQSQVCEAGAAAGGEGEPEPAGTRGNLAHRHPNNVHHGRRAHKSRAKGHRAGEACGKNRLKALRGGAAGALELLSSESGSLHNSPTDSYLGSSRNSPGAGLQLEGEPMLTPSEGSDTSAAPLSEAGRAGQRRSASRDSLKGGGALEKESHRRSYPLNAASLNGAPKGGKYDDVTLMGAEVASGGCMKTGLWKSETTV
ncbi:adhesion G protein-coupled receptor A2 [Homo sapiens]|uniref:Isoform 2 of Adhesion G protein-coupled receptor A2 n=1 Tax=Homo sapiens TaxID=9606 RepID=Q96PE1-2|nr:G protein-coupled receptor 124, isoform CRA_c [Homo sapiens]KAI2549633.1 adhesion G protein-coupled receptor A2 [Homo sapiens]KAI4010274.1 adhesion G protein-coupled receptor A2 [Homo sapiens]